MGSVIGCLGAPRDDDSPGCFCFCLPWPAVNRNNNSGVTARLRADTRVAPEQGHVPLAGSADSGQVDSMNTFCCPPMPLPYDDPRFSHQIGQRLLVTAHGKATMQFHKSNQLGESKNTDTRSTCADVKDHSGGQNAGGTHVYVPSDGEDGCPICLEEYDHENPEIVLQCSHHFHLGCIYEWMERSESCPLCAKVMLFNTTE